MKEEDKDIRDVFESLSKGIKANAPSFEVTWNGAQNTKKRKIRRLRVLPVAASILVLIALGTSFLFQKSCNSIRSNQSNFALLKWQAPTDVLLEKSYSTFGNNIFDLPTDQILDWEVDEEQLIK